MTWWVAGSVVVGGIAGGYLSGNAAKDAAGQQSESAWNALQENKRQYDQTRTDMAPYRDIGSASLGQLGSKMGLPGYDANAPGAGSLSKNFSLADFVKDPGYDFRMSEGLKGVDNSGAARGMQLSGATLKALDQYGQGFASNEYQNSYNRFNNDQSNQFNRLSGLAGTGQQANTTLANVGQNYSNSNANLITSGGAARAAGTMGQANAYTNALNQGTNYFTQHQMMNRIFPQGGSGYTPSNYNQSSIGTNGYNPVME